MHKRYIIVAIVAFIVGLLMWNLSGTYALYNQSYSGNKIVNGNNWSINIVNISDIILENDAKLIEEVSSIGTTLNFEVSLPNPKSSLILDFEIENMGNLDAILYDLRKSGLSNYDKEYINYEIISLNNITFKTDKEEGSILKKGDKHHFRISVNYQDNVNENNIKGTTLNLGSTIIYEEK